MGKNNKARRKQKEKKRKSGLVKKAHYDPFLLESGVGDICELLEEAMDLKAVPPRGHIIDQENVLRSYPAPLRDLFQIVVSFLRFVFGDEEPKGGIDALRNLRNAFEETGNSDCYALLNVYCSISDSKFCVENYKNVLQFCDRYKDHEEYQSFIKVVDLFLYCKGLKEVPAQFIPYYLRKWTLGNGRILLIDNEIAKVLRLKKLNPTQKTVQNLEKSLSKVEWNNIERSKYFVGLSILLKNFVVLKLGKIEPSDWEQYETLSSMLTLDMDTHQSKWGSNHSVKREYLHTLYNNVETLGMSFDEKTKYLVLAFRGELLSSGPLAPTTERQLQNIIMHLSSGVPKNKKELAAFCAKELTMLLSPIAKQLGSKLRIHNFSKFAKILPEDYRIQIFSYLFDQSNYDLHPREFKEINHEAFYLGAIRFGLKEKELQKFLDLFYKPVSLESKKYLVFETYRRIFHGSAEKDVAVRTWNHFHKQVFHLHGEPFIGVQNGNHCEAEFLFYIALSFSEQKNDTNWIKEDMVHTILQQFIIFLDKSPKDYNKEIVARLLLNFAKSKAEIFLRYWQEVAPILYSLRSKAEIKSTFSLLKKFLQSEIGEHIDAETRQKIESFLKKPRPTADDVEQQVVKSRVTKMKSTKKKVSKKRNTQKKKPEVGPKRIQGELPFTD